MSPLPAPPAPTDALQQARRWLRLLCVREITSSERRQWLAWLDASPQHMRAWQQVELHRG